MNNLRSLIWAFGAFVLCGCAVISSDVTDEALPVPDFVELTRQAERYRGETVVLGGYVLSVENLEDHTRIIALEAPLGTGQRPKSKDLSRGRLHLLYDGSLKCIPGIGRSRLAAVSLNPLRKSRPLTRIFVFRSVSCICGPLRNRCLQIRTGMIPGAHIPGGIFPGATGAGVIENDWFAPIRQGRMAAE